MKSAAIAALLVIAVALSSTSTAYAQSTCAETSFINEDMYGYYISRSSAVLAARTISQCCSLCYSSSTCYAWTFDTRPGPIFGCYLRTRAVRTTASCGGGCISGVDSRVASLTSLSTVSGSYTTPLEIIGLSSSVLGYSWTNSTGGATLNLSG